MLLVAFGGRRSFFDDDNLSYTVLVELSEYVYNAAIIKIIVTDTIPWYCKL